MDILADLNASQLRAVQHIDGPMLVLAGAGSGKTRVITRRVAYLVSQGIKPWEILAITFTNKAAGEMSERIEQIAAVSGITACTFHSLCARLLRQYANFAGLEQNYSIYDRDDQIRVVKLALETLQMAVKEHNPSQLLSAISKAKNKLQTSQTFASKASTHREKTTSRVYDKYQSILTGNNALDFDDLLLKMAILLRDNPGIRQELSAKYRYVLVDEYQDTNHAQYLLAHSIALDHGNICVTGDPDQSIYSWRGANIRNILEFERDYPNALVVRLEENYRSTRSILSAASALISRNEMRKKKALFTSRPGGIDVKVVCYDDEKSEGAGLVSQIAEHVNSGKSLDDIGIFYRVNSLSRAIEEKLLVAGIPYRVARGTEFYNRKLIRDILAYLKVIANPSDDVSCMRIINTPTRGIGAKTIGRLRNYASMHQISLLEACRQSPLTGLAKASAAKTQNFANIIDSLIGEIDSPVQELIEKVAKLSGINKTLEEKTEENMQARSNIGELVTTAAEFDTTSPNGGSLLEYLHQISLVSDVDNIETASGVVTLMTLHAAKGLEFPIVFMVGCEEGLLPFVRAMGQAESSEMEEERRLAFVGITRAMDELQLSSVKSRMIRGSYTSQAQSRFLTEIGTEGVSFDNRCTMPRATPGRNRSFTPARSFYKDVDTRNQIEEMDIANIFPPEYEYLRPGSKVYHRKYGSGTVMKIVGRWPETRVDVMFAALGVKRLVLALAPLDIEQ